MKFTVLLALVAAATAHVHMVSPGALHSKDNPLVIAASKQTGGQNLVDDSLNSPLSGDGTNFPCKMYHLDIAANKPGSESVADWAPGSSQKVTFGTGGAPHGGGSCQLSFSVDQGKTFKVVKSFEGGCPSDAQGTMVPELDFEVPKDTPAGSAIFAWSWQNRIGNREFYMNCAHVTITSEGAGSEAVAFDQRPEIFEANLGSGCKTVETFDTKYPDPGPNVVIAPGANLGDPTGGAACGAAPVAKAVGNAPSTPDSGLDASLSAGSSSSSTISAPASGSSSSTIAGLTTDPTNQGRCGPVDGVSYTCKGGEHGPSCSSFGYCGNTAQHSGPGCQPQFGSCDGVSSSAKALAVASSSASSPSSASSFLGVQPSSSQSSPSNAAAEPSSTAASLAITTGGGSTASATASILLPGSANSSLTATTTTPLPAASGNSTALSADLPIHPEGKCGVLADGSKFTCKGSGRGCACSSAGWCGISPAHFGQGCQSAFGTCGEEAASCKVTIASGIPKNATVAGTAKAAGPVVTTSLYTTTVPVLTVIVTETAGSVPSDVSAPLTSDTAAATSTDVPTTLVTQTKPATSSEESYDSASEAAGATGTILPRFKRPAGSFFSFLKSPKAVSATGTKHLAKATMSIA